MVEIILCGGPFDGKVMEAPEGAADLLLDMIEEDSIQTWVYKPTLHIAEGRQVWAGERING